MKWWKDMVSVFRKAIEARRITDLRSDRPNYQLEEARKGHEALKAAGTAISAKMQEQQARLASVEARYIAQLGGGHALH